MIRYFIFTLILLLASAVCQQWMPSLGESLYRSRLLLSPLVFFCIAQVFPYSLTLVFALITGFIWDIEHVLAPYHGMIEVKLETVDNLKFGYSMFLFGGLGFLTKFIQANFRYKGWAISVMMVFLLFITYLLGENLLLFFIRGTAPVGHSFIYQIANTALFSSLLAPFLFWILRKVWFLFKLRDDNGNLEELGAFIIRKD